jgi:hypothetical protein
MKSFHCPHCNARVAFESDLCANCKHATGFDSRTMTMAALEPVDGGSFRRVAAFARHAPSDERVVYCANHAQAVCNWLTDPSASNGLCVACNLNRTIPNLSEPGSLEAWGALERAKKRLVYSLLRFGLPLDAAASGKGRLTFDFVRDATTGHLDGVITIDIIEADAVERERQRQQLGEPYRSLLGHLRHESGHYYWMILIEAGGFLDEFRAMFGDERLDYGQALARHHAQGVRNDWQDTHVSAYASAHPWEDWAETWAHYLHIVDAVDTCEAEGMEPRAAGFLTGAIWPFKASDVYREQSFEALKKRWIPLTLALNAINRSIGHADYYPFVIPPAAYKKLDFVHRVIRRSA